MPTEHPTTWSLEKRLKRRLLAALAVLWLGGSLIAVIGVRFEINEVMDSALLENAQRLLALPAGADMVDDLSDHHEPVRFLLTDGEGHVFWRSQDAPPDLQVQQLHTGLYTQHGNRLAVQYSRDNKRIAVAFESLQDRREALWEVIRWQLIPLLVLLPLVAWTLNRALRRGFATLDPLKAWLAEHDLSRGHAKERAPLPEHDVPRELAPLVHTINDLLDRVGRMVAAEQAFAANSAHELRTPVAAARAQAQRLLEEPACQGNPGAHERVQALLRQLDQLGHVSTKLLQLSRVHSGLGLSREPVELQTLVRLVGDEFRAPGISERLQFDAPAEPVWVLGDLDALGIALRNLIENALRHTGGAAVRVRVEPAGALVVEDDGPGVSADALHRVTQPFQRGHTGAEGHGLGLSIAESVTRQMGGRLVLQSPTHDGRGFRVSMHLARCMTP